jgi:hypothetical protein
MRLGGAVQNLAELHFPHAPGLSKKDDAYADHHPALTKVAGRGSLSEGGGLIRPPPADANKGFSSRQSLRRRVKPQTMYGMVVETSAWLISEM